MNELKEAVASLRAAWLVVQAHRRDVEELRFAGLCLRILDHAIDPRLDVFFSLDEKVKATTKLLEESEAALKEVAEHVERCYQKELALLRPLENGGEVESLKLTFEDRIGIQRTNKAAERLQGKAPQRKRKVFRS